jgi:hypothetical protein
MSVLDLIKKTKVKVLSFEKHPCRSLDIETKVHYLNGLALLAYEDGDINEEEKEYLTTLLISFDMDEEILQDSLEFAKNPNEESIIEMIKLFSKEDIKFNFMMDSMVLMQKDSRGNEAKKALIKEYFEMFKINSATKEELLKVYEMFKSRDGKALFRYFKKTKENHYYNNMFDKKLFEYLLDYYKIETKFELTQEERSILEFDFFRPKFEEGELSGATEIMKKSVSNEQFCVYLNSKFLTDKIDIDSKDRVFDIKTEDVIIDLSKSAIYFDNGLFKSKNELTREEISDFYSEDELKDIFGIWAGKLTDEQIQKINEYYTNVVTGITTVGVEEFIVWVNDTMEEEYKVVKLWENTRGSFLRGALKDIDIKTLVKIFHEKKEFVWDRDKNKIGIYIHNVYKSILSSESLDINNCKEYDTFKDVSFRMMR